MSSSSDIEKNVTPDYRREIEMVISKDWAGDIGHQGRVVEPNTHGFYKNVGNPGVLGLTAHAVTLMLLATQYMGWRGVTAPQIYIGNLWFFAGLYMFTTSQWCLIKGETFAATVFGTFGGFYLSFAAILTPAFNVAAIYSGAAGSATSVAAELESLCTFLYVWNGAFMVIWIASFKTNLALNILFFGVVAGVFCLAGMYAQLGAVAGGNGGSAAMALNLSTAGGAFLFLSASSGFYLVFAQLTESVGFPFTLPVGDLSRFWPKKSVE